MVHFQYVVPAWLVSALVLFFQKSWVCQELWCWETADHNYQSSVPWSVICVLFITYVIPLWSQPSYAPWPPKLSCTFRLFFFFLFTCCLQLSPVQNLSLLWRQATDHEPATLHFDDLRYSFTAALWQHCLQWGGTLKVNKPFSNLQSVTVWHKWEPELSKNGSKHDPPPQARMEQI